MLRNVGNVATTRLRAFLILTSSPCIFPSRRASVTLRELSLRAALSCWPFGELWGIISPALLCSIMSSATKEWDFHLKATKLDLW